MEGFNVLVLAAPLLRRADGVGAEVAHADLAPAVADETGDVVA
jgi:hypothetical protein